jgi:hypothetical protein
LTLYECTFDERWFLAARELADLTLAHFHDSAGGFFSTADDHEQLLVRRKDIEDAPIPSGNSAAALALLRLHAFTGEHVYRDAAADALRIMQQAAARFPTAFGHALQAIDFYLGPVKEIALVGEPLDELLATVRATYRPKTVLAGKADGAETFVPLLEHRSTVDRSPTAYVCQNFACERPVTDPEALAALLG